MNTANHFIIQGGCIYKLLWLIFAKGHTELWMAEKQFSALEHQEITLRPGNYTESRLHGMGA